MADYYQELGLSRGASADEVKRAYRKLALKFHPDRNKGDRAAEEKFKRMSEAYAVLSDPEKKQQYDTFGSETFHHRYSQEDILRGTNFANIFKDFGFSEGAGFESVLGALFGGGRPGASTRHNGAGRGDLEATLAVSLDEVLHGGQREVSLAHLGAGKSLTVQIPRGVKAGSRLRLSGKGRSSARGGAPGDLYLRIQLLAHAQLQPVGEADLECELTLPLSRALLGGQVTIPTLGGAKTIEVPAGVAPGSRIRLRGLGLPHSSDAEQRGDLYARVRLQWPKSLSAEQRHVAESLQKVGL